MKKILVVFGTRPEAIKMAPLVKELKKESSFTVKVCVTAQHREMLDQVLSFFKIIPDFDLNLMQPNQSLNQLSGRIFTEIDVVLENFKPDIVLVHGDTTTSSVVAMASFYREIKVGHVEAGLRTYNKQAPFPEEINRQITGRIADFHFAPTEASAQNLLSEKVSEKDVFVTGNTVIDALLWGIKNINESNVEIEKLQQVINSTKKLIVVTGHRRESFGDKFQSFCEALKELSQREDVQIIYPVHLNPNVQKTVHQILKNNTNVHLIDPLNYEAFIWLLNKSYLIITDSGGIQEEAPSLKKPVLVTRNVTERQEAVESGVVKLVGTSKEVIVTQAVKLLENKEIYSKMISKENPYGNGTASSKIVEILKSF
ncbi:MULTISPECIES: non-hydrolyzing UDP-N-acetylglucosamine 2-epimerase [Tenacibaculum]|uniref:non-hydrolyzing UDP-N-acetylglucosamine 2-epimerase n=1 Tax=Tenacibaculum TaxID=104267 RepID=UPI001F0A7D42|nr:MULTISPECIES: UDP-N-acetylglucosamine 2-epimerase (non-hydrolyzing) [Tenacibaculum]MCH3881946.1 UDP-N-acetylglucosamine 2-epimerase (non-hydrolyzing) [Tenacibaculum aquimarinum]MDO6600699.1 UDP-N-acetylglucosamine 2-epimerase (non-hydrolyzing) [Tenacibaculum sp. 1_MG-2023]